MVSHCTVSGNRKKMYFFLMCVFLCNIRTKQASCLPFYFHIPTVFIAIYQKDKLECRFRQKRKKKGFVCLNDKEYFTCILILMHVTD